MPRLKLPRPAAAFCRVIVEAVLEVVEINFSGSLIGVVIHKEHWNRFRPNSPGLFWELHRRIAAARIEWIWLSGHAVPANDLMHSFDVQRQFWENRNFEPFDAFEGALKF